MMLFMCRKLVFTELWKVNMDYLCPYFVGSLCSCIHINYQTFSYEVAQ